MSNLRIRFSLTHLVTEPLIRYLGTARRGRSKVQRQSDKSAHYGPGSRWPELRLATQPPSIRTDCHACPPLAKVQD